MKRTLRSFTPFAIAFSFTSITTGLFTTYGFALNTAGPAGIWMWVVAGAGQVMVALILAQLTAHIPLSGYSYQGGSRLATPRVGWWFGWISYVFLAIVVVSVDYVLVTQALIPLFSLSLSTTGAIWMTVAVILYQGALICSSPRIVALLNATAVATEIIGISIFACGMVIMTSGSRLVWSMSRDRRFPGHQLFGRVSLSLPTPVWANVLIMVGGIILILAIGHQESSRSR